MLGILDIKFNIHQFEIFFLIFLGDGFWLFMHIVVWSVGNFFLGEVGVNIVTRLSAELALILVEVKFAYSIIIFSLLLVY